MCLVGIVIGINLKVYVDCEIKLNIFLYFSIMKNIR